MIGQSTNNINGILMTTIIQYCDQILQSQDFNRKQQLIELVNKFLMDFNNISVFQSLVVRDNNSNTIFVLYELLNKQILANVQFINVPISHQTRLQMDDININDKLRCTEVIKDHIQIFTEFATKCQIQQYPKYATNTMINAITIMIRKYWVDIANIDDLIDQLINLFLGTNNTILLSFGCRFFDSLLNSVKQYIYSSGYLEFRKIMIAFQRLTLQKIISSTQQVIRQQIAQYSLLTLYQKNQPLAEAIIQLLNQLINFNFNLSFYEMDVDGDLKENQIVNFPDSYYPFLSDIQIINCLFQSSTQFYQINKAITIQLLFNLQRLACCRISLFLGKKCKKHFRRALWEGMLFLLNQFNLYYQDSEVTIEIISLLIRLINNFTLRKLHKFKDIFDNVIIHLQSLNNHIINTQGFLVSSNNVCVKLQEAWNQILYQVQLLKPAAEQITQQIQQIINNLFHQQLLNILQGNCFRDMPLGKVKKFKKLIDQNFSHFQTTFQYLKSEYLLILLNQFNNLVPAFHNFEQLNSQEKLICLQKLSSLICLISSFVLYNSMNEINLGFDYYQACQRDENKPSCEQSGRIVLIIIDIISIVNQSNILSDIPQNRIFHICILIFIENFLNLTLQGIQFDETNKQIKVSSNLFNQMIKERQNITYMQVLVIFLEKWYIYMQFSFHIFQLGDEVLIDHSLILIEPLFSKVKQGTPRRYFRESTINTILQQFVLQLELTCFSQVNFIKKRQQIFRIIASVWVDDQQDDYIPALVEIYKKIKFNISNETNKVNLLKYIWDLIGVATKLDQEAIYRVFLRIIYPDLAQLLNPDMLSVFAKDYDSSLGLLQLIKSIFTNKNTRLNNENIQIVLYQIYGKAITFFQILSQYIFQQVTGQQDIPSSTIKQAGKLIQVMNEIQTSKQINQGFFLTYGDQSFLEHFKQQLILIMALRPHFQNYPKYKKKLYEFLENTIIEQCETLAYRCPIDQYLQVLLIAKDTLDGIISNSQPKGEEQINDDANIIFQISSLLIQANTFLIQEALIGTGNEVIKQKISDIQVQGKDLFNSIFEQSYSLALAYAKVQKIQQAVPDLIFVVSLFNPLQYQGQFVFLVQQSNLDNQAQLMDLIGQAFVHLEVKIHPQAQSNFTKKLRNVIDIVNDKLSKN